MKNQLLSAFVILLTPAFNSCSQENSKSELSPEFSIGELPVVDRSAALGGIANFSLAVQFLGDLASEKDFKASIEKQLKKSLSAHGLPIDVREAIGSAEDGYLLVEISALVEPESGISSYQATFYVSRWAAIETGNGELKKRLATIWHQSGPGLTHNSRLKTKLEELVSALSELLGKDFSNAK